MTRVMCIHPIKKNLSILGKEGLLPNDKFKFTQLLKITAHALFFTLIMAINITIIVKAIKKGSGMELNRATCITIPIAQLIFKAVALLINNEYFNLVMEDLKSDIFNNHSMELNIHIEFVYKVSELLRKYYTIAIGLFLFVTAFLPFVSNVRLMMPPPFDMGKYMVFYKFIHFLMTIYMAINSISYDVIYMSLITLCIAQLNILQERLVKIHEESRRMLENKDVEHLSMEDDSNGKFIIGEELILKKCIVLHDRINV